MNFECATTPGRPLVGLESRGYLTWTSIVALGVAALAVSGCGGCEESATSPPGPSASPSEPHRSDPHTTTKSAREDVSSPSECMSPAGEAPNASAFLSTGLTQPIAEVACTLSDGTDSVCLQVPIKGVPEDHAVGPFCPRNIRDGEKGAGMWIDKGKVWELSGAFIAGLAEFYGDPKWQLYDPKTGDIRVTDSKEACEAAARPNVAPEYQNHCVQCALEHVDGGIPKTFLIPKKPVAAPKPNEIGGRSKVGVALNGAHFDPPAPVKAILAAYTIAAFDDCGGHINPNTGYHYHAATGCGRQIKQCDGHAPLIGYALDGYGIYAMSGADGVEPNDLDGCRGHSDKRRGYHYHAASPGENMFIGCFRGLTVAIEGNTTKRGRGRGPAECTDPPRGPCCGDGVCDGPETPANCKVDCP